MEIRRSSTSIIKLLLVLLFCYLLVDFFYEGNRLLKTYLVLLYETILEMTRFGVHGFWTFGIKTYLDWQMQLMMDGSVPIERYDEFYFKSLEYVWDLSLACLYCLLSFLIIYRIRKNWKKIANVNRQGILFLMLSPAVGMAFDIILRCLLFTQTGMEIDFIYDKHKGMYAIVPVMTFLCLLSIVYSVKIYEELIRAQEEKNRLYFYKQQLSDMTGHVQEMERLYDGIRGMKHDMNNYIADMEQLLHVSMSKEQLEGAMETEAQGYLRHMKNAMERLSIRYQTGNPVMDVIMNRKWQECEKEGITLISDFIYPEQLEIEAFDLGILLNNALDNAIEACKKCDRDVSIQVHSYHKGRMFFLQIENDCVGGAVLYSEEQTLRTTKEDDWLHGIGLKNMRSVVDQYFGTMYHEVRDDVFTLTIMLQGRQAKNYS